MIIKSIHNSFGKVKKQKLLIENYFYLTVIQVVNTFFYFLIYPFSIKTLGADNYGLFIYSNTIISYVTLFISFGIDLPALRILSQNIDNLQIKSELISDVVSTKVVLSVISLFTIFLLMMLFPKIRILLLINSLQAFSSIFLLNWYFQGIQRTKWFALFQLIIRIITIIMIFLLIKDVQDLELYSIIVSGSTLSIAILSFYYLIQKEKINLKLTSFKRIYNFLRKSYHFFLNSSISVVRVQSTNIFVGSGVGMNEVSYFDLASKIILLPQSIVSNINNALFPKILKSKEINKNTVKNIFIYEFLIGISFIILIGIFGKSVIRIFLHENITMVHNLTIIMSLTILSWLLVGCIVNFVFIPLGRFDLVSKNQLIAFIGFFASCFIGLKINKSVYIIATAVAVSATLEMIFCFYMAIRLNFFTTNKFIEQQS